MPDESPILPNKGEVEQSTEPPIVKEQDELVPPGEIEELVRKKEPAPPAPPPAPPVPPSVATRDKGAAWLWPAVILLLTVASFSMWWVWKVRRHEAPGDGASGTA